MSDREYAVENTEDMLMDELGDSYFLECLLRVMSSDLKEYYFRYIMRTNGIEDRYGVFDWSGFRASLVKC